jgi:phosphopantothenoylcysteine synthetase/decarboxylase
VKILLTSGGTKVKIDDVRHIGNMSQGTFGTHLCKAFLKAGHEVTFLYAKDSKCLHELRLDLSYALHMDAYSESILPFHSVINMTASHHLKFLEDIHSKYHPYAYADFDEYARKLMCCIRSFKPDIVVLSAAVSDYTPVKTEGKISSELDEINLKLVKTPKLIRQVKQILPDCFLVGFKLLVGSTQEQLEDAMEEQRNKAGADMVVGNDLRDIRAGQHKLTVLSIDCRHYESGPASGEMLAKDLVNNIIRDAETLLGEYAHLGAPGRNP